MESVIYFILFFISYPLHYLFYETDLFSIKDVPNERSMHSEPTKKGAGVIFNTLFLLAISLAYYWKDIDIRVFTTFFSGSLFLGILGFVDDRKNLSSILRLSLEFAFFCVLFYVVNFQISIFGITIYDRFLNSFLISFFTIFVVNLTNFMDGLDLYLSGVFITYIINFALIYGLQVDSAYIIFLTYLACLAPYFIYNFPTARLFMGDSGSLPIGFVFAVAPFFATNYASFEFIFGPILLPIFWIDGIFTLVQRIIAKKNILTAHKEHLYQKVQGVLFTKKQTIIVFISLNLLGGIPYYILQKNSIAALGLTIAINLGIYSAIYYLYKKKWNKISTQS